MLFKEITIINEKFDVEENMYVGIENDRIDYIGKTLPQKDYGRVYQGKDRLLMPAFYNAHAHSPMALMRGYGENLVLQDWLNKKIFPFEDKLSDEAVYWGTMLCIAESLRFGIVSSSDMYFFVSAMAEAVKHSGSKANISRSIVNFTGEDFDEMDSVKEAKEAIRNYHGKENGRILMDASLHAEYTSDEKTARAISEFAKDENLIMHVHVSETQFEHEECKKRHNGMTPVQYLSDCGLFDVPALAAHCVWCEGEDFDILKEKGVTVASNPISNLKLASGMCNVPKMLDKGIAVGIGTDSVASNNSLNFLEEMKAFATISKVKANNPTVVTPKDTIKAATYYGAMAQGRKDCGVLKEGNKADILVMRTDVANMHPIHNMLNNIIYSASGSDIVLTMSDGKVLYENGVYTTIDMERTIFEVEKATENILKQL